MYSCILNTILIKNILNKQTIRKFVLSIWFFPVIVLAFMLVLGSFKISGSSVGMYNQLFDRAASDQSLIAGQPRELRSDEWLVNTPTTISQTLTGYHRVNHANGNGQDVSLVADAPYKDWSIIFKPTNLFFFILSPEIAFALRWWAMGYILIMSVYFLVLHFLPKKIILACLFSVIFYFAPIMQWWYQNVNLLSVGYAFFAALLFLKLLETKRTVCIKLGLAVGTAYFVTCFALILYPPYLIPIAYAVSVSVLSWLLHMHGTNIIKVFRKSFAYIILAFLITVLSTGAFYTTRSNAIKALANTSYPGKRVIAAGDAPKLHILNSHFAPVLLDDDKAINYYPEVGLGNQSESSQFIFPLITIMMLGISICYKRYEFDKVITYQLLGPMLLLGLVFARLFFPHFDFIWKLTGISSIPHNRLVICIGIILFFLLVFCIEQLKFKKLKFSRMFVLLFALSNLLIYAVLFYVTTQKTPSLTNGLNIYTIIILVCVMPIFGYLLVSRKFRLALGLLAIYSLASTLQVNPLYKGFGYAANSQLSQTIRTIAKTDNSKWVTTIDNWKIQNFTYLNGANSLSGVYIYPQNELWKPLDQDGSKFTSYNSFQYATFNIDDGESRESVLTPMSLLHFNIKTTPCSSYLKDQNVGFILTTHKITSECADLVHTIQEGNTFYIYKIITKIE